MTSPTTASAGPGDALASAVQALVTATQELAKSAGLLTNLLGPQGNGAPALGAATVQVNVWEDDPFSEIVPTANPPIAPTITVPVPEAATGSLTFSIGGQRPSPQRYNPGTGEFRYWLATEAIARGIGFWANVLPKATRWSSNNPILQVNLAAGDLLNANYTRTFGLRFYKKLVNQVTVSSGESPDVVCHELGHAILDALRPELFHAATIEAAAFHEAFGDMSSILASLTLPTTRDRVIAEMGGRLNITSRLSRLAEQLGWAIRQSNPTAVDSDCLRNAANRLFYEQPELLPPQAPARQLSSEFHSFSRVFTGGFLDALNNMLAIAGAPTAQTLEGVAIDMGRLLVDGIMTAPVVPAYYSQVAASMIQAARTRNAGRYATAISSAFIERGLLSPQAVASLTTAPRPQPQMGDAGVGFAATSAEGSADAMLSYGPALSDGYAKGFADAPELPLRPIKGDGLGLQLLAHAAGETPLFDVASASTFGMMPLPERTAESSAEAFVEDLIQTGRLDISDVETPLSFASDQSERKTHKLVRTQNGVALKRLRFDCFGCCAVG